jgi:hypothetical protein
MMKSPAQLYLRVRLPDGSYPYLKATFASNGRLRPHHAIHNQKVVHFPGSAYYLRFQVNGKRVWEPAGSDPSLASVALQKKAHVLQGSALGLTAPVPMARVPPPDVPPPADGKAERPLADCIAKYIAETEEHKSKKTLDAYRLMVTAFAKLIDRDNLEDLTRDDLLTYIAALRKTADPHAQSATASITCRYSSTISKSHPFSRVKIFPSTPKKPTIPTSLKSCLSTRPRTSLTCFISCFVQGRGNRRLSMCAGLTLIWRTRHITSRSISTWATARKTKKKGSYCSQTCL